MRPINNACAVVFLKVATRCIRQHWVTAVFRVQTDCIKSSITFQTPFHLTNMCLLNNNLPCLMNIFLNHFLSLLLFYLSYLFGTDFVLCRIVYRTCTLDNNYVCNNLQKHTCFLSLCTGDVKNTDFNKSRINEKTTSNYYWPKFVGVA